MIFRLRSDFFDELPRPRFVGMVVKLWDLDWGSSASINRRTYPGSPERMSFAVFDRFFTVVCPD